MKGYLQYKHIYHPNILNMRVRVKIRSYHFFVIFFIFWYVVVLIYKQRNHIQVHQARYFGQFLSQWNVKLDTLDFIFNRHYRKHYRAGFKSQASNLMCF